MKDAKAESNALQARYARAAHAMQSAVAAYIAKDNPGVTEEAILRALKHLRVGVNSSMSDVGGLSTLLISKGIITETEYMEAIVSAMEREAETNAAKARALLSNPNLRFA